jgi:hypothetical protein
MLNSLYRQLQHRAGNALHFPPILGKNAAEEEKRKKSGFLQQGVVKWGERNGRVMETGTISEHSFLFK